jgi:hypothetical protein
VGISAGSNGVDDANFPVSKKELGNSLWRQVSLDYNHRQKIRRPELVP